MPRHLKGPVFVPEKHFDPSLTFASKQGGYQNGAPFKCSPLSMVSILRLVYYFLLSREATRAELLEQSTVEPFKVLLAFTEILDLAKNPCHCIILCWSVNEAVQMS